MQLCTQTATKLKDGRRGAVVILKYKSTTLIDDYPDSQKKYDAETKLILASAQ